MLKDIRNVESDLDLYKLDGNCMLHNLYNEEYN